MINGAKHCASYRVYLHWYLFVSALLLLNSSCYAIDNPDAPDYIEEFKARAQVYETVIHEQAETTQDYIKAYDGYEVFLDDELNEAYKSLLKHLDNAQKLQLKQSQRNWIEYRDAEFEFITDNWNRQNFGSSAALSRGAYRTTIIKNRILVLLSYLMNYE